MTQALGIRANLAVVHRTAHLGSAGSSFIDGGFSKQVEVDLETLND